MCSLPRAAAKLKCQRVRSRAFLNSSNEIPRDLHLVFQQGLECAVTTHLIRKANQSGGPHSYKQCPTKRGCLDNELQTVQDMAKACKSSRKLAEASKVSVPQSDKVCPKRIKVWDKFFFGQCSYKLGRRANQAEEPHSYKQCPMKRNWLDMVSKQANSPNSTV